MQQYLCTFENFLSANCVHTYNGIVTQTALLGVGYVSAIGMALTMAGQRFVQQKEGAELSVKLWFAGGLITCLFWVRYISYQ